MVKLLVYPLKFILEPTVPIFNELTDIVFVVVLHEFANCCSVGIVPPPTLSLN